MLLNIASMAIGWEQMPRRDRLQIAVALGQRALQIEDKYEGTFGLMHLASAVGQCSHLITGIHASLF